MPRRKPVELPDITDPDAPGSGWSTPDLVIPIVESGPPAPTATPSEPTYTVAPRRRVKTQSVVLESGAAVTAEDVGGLETLDALVRGGSVIRQ